MRPTKAFLSLKVYFIFHRKIALWPFLYYKLHVEPGRWGGVLKSTADVKHIHLYTGSHTSQCAVKPMVSGIAKYNFLELGFINFLSGKGFRFRNVYFLTRTCFLVGIGSYMKLKEIVFLSSFLRNSCDMLLFLSHILYNKARYAIRVCLNFHDFERKRKCAIRYSEVCIYLFCLAIQMTANNFLSCTGNRYPCFRVTWAHSHPDKICNLSRFVCINIASGCVSSDVTLYQSHVNSKWFTITRQYQEPPVQLTYNVSPSKQNNQHWRSGSWHDTIKEDG